MSIAPEVILFCQKEIIESGLVLDEDLCLLQPIECSRQKPVTYLITQGVAVLGSGIGAALQAVKNGDAYRSLKIGLLFSLPALSSILLSFYRATKAENQKNAITQLLVEFRNLSRVHNEVNDFIKHFNFMVETSSDQLLRQSEETIHDLSEHTCDIQSMITCEMRQVIVATHVGLQNLSLDLSGFEQATMAVFNYDSISDCLRNVNFVEGQVVLLRSHLLTSIVLLSSWKGNPGILRKVLDEHVPSLIFIIKEGIHRLKVKLDDVRFPVNPPTLMSLTNLENLVGNRKYVSIPRMKRHVIKINDGICCTLTKLRTLLVTLENVESESQMISLQETLAVITQELLKCCRSSADLEKLIQLVSNNQKTRLLDMSAITETPEDDCAGTSTSEQVPEKEELGTDSDYQVFGNYMSDSDDDSEVNAVRFYKKHISSTADWLAELKQSEEFQRRQDKFHTGKPVTSTPVEQKNCELQAVESLLSIGSSTTSSGDFVRVQIPTPPPIPSAVLSSREISEILKDYSSPSTKEMTTSSSVVPTPPPIPCDAISSREISEILREDASQSTEDGATSSSVDPAPKITPVIEENTALLNSLKDVINKMGPRAEEEFE